MLPSAMAEQVGRRLRRERRACRTARVRRFVLPDDEAAADREVGFGVRRTVAKEGREFQAVGVKRQGGVRVEHEVGGGVERDGLHTAEADRLPRTDRRDLGVHPRGVAGHGVFARQAEQDGEVGPVSAAGLGQRAVQVDAQAPDPVEDAAVAAGRQKALSRPPRTHRVRAGRADADFEDVESTDRFHGPRPPSPANLPSLSYQHLPRGASRRPCLGPPTC